MYCSQCGTNILDNAKFCPNCGSSLATSVQTNLTESPATTSVVPKRRSIWLIVTGILLVVTYAAMFIPAFAGQKQIPQSGFGSMFWTGLFFYIWWKQRNRSGWHGALIGAALGVLVFFVAAVIGGYVNHAGAA